MLNIVELTIRKQGELGIEKKLYNYKHSLSIDKVSGEHTTENLISSQYVVEICKSIDTYCRISWN